VFCNSCGSTLPDDVLFCLNCGAKLPEAAPPEVIDAPADPPQPAFPEAGDVPAAAAVALCDAPPVSCEPPAYAPPSMLKPLRPSKLTIVASSALCLLLCILLMAGALLYLLRGAVLDMPDTIKEQGVASFVESIGGAKLILENIPENVVEFYNINESTIEAVLQNESINNAVSDLLSDYIDAALSGDLEYMLDDREIVNALKRNERTIEEITGYQFTEKNYDSIAMNLKDALQDYTPERILEDANLPSNLFGAATSLMPLIAVALLCVLLLFNLIAINYKRLRRSALYFGVAAFCAGLFFTLLWMLWSLLNRFGGSLNLGDMLSSSPLNIKTDILITGLIVLAAGALAIGAYILIRIVRKSSAPATLKRPKWFKLTTLCANGAFVLAVGILSFVFWYSVWR